MSVGVDGDSEALRLDALRRRRENPFKVEQTDAASAHILGAWYVDDGVGVEFFATLAEAERYAKDVFALDLAREVERLTVERDLARDVAVALEGECAEALRIARAALKEVFMQPSIKLLSAALADVVRILGDDETETQDKGSNDE